MTMLPPFVEGVRWTDVLDVSLLAWVIYQALLVVRGTRALQVLSGLLLSVGMYVVSERLQLYAVHWLLEKFFSYIVIAVLILFQSDIRRGLAGAGVRLFRPVAPGADSTAVEEMVRAATTMASRRIGALIAIEREASLDGPADSAARIDARVTQDLLLSIFHPSSPLHDGAVVVRGDRILAAKAFLNLSFSRDVSRYYGTRHRAAIGLTEETDAVVILVSEERGTASVVVAGEVLPTADANELRARLVELLGVAGARRRA
ncbi:MAG: hypothetical protein RLZZ299_1374 [Pseudomonadota bacterium]